MAYTIVSYPIIVNGDTQWSAQAYYMHDTHELECICIQDPTTGLNLSAHSNFKHVFFHDNDGSWESWYPYFLNSANTRFIIKNLAHDTFIMADENDNKTFWQVWDEDNPNSSDYDGMVVFEGSIPITCNSTINREDTIDEIFGDDEPEPPKQKRKYTKKTDKAPKTVDPNKPKRQQSVGMKAFQVYAKIMRPMVNEENPGISLGEAQKIIGDMWKELSDEDKQQYFDEASSTEIE